MGMRKIKSILEADPEQILVLDISKPSPDLTALCDDSQVCFEKRPFSPVDIADKFLVIAATSNPELNRTIAELCHTSNILCNIVDAPVLSSFIVPASITRGDLTVAISTAGQSPALAKHLRQKLEDFFGNEYEQILVILGRLRPLLLALELTTEENTAIFRNVVSSGLLEALAQQDLDNAAASLRKTLPEDLHDKIGELLNGIA